MSEDAQAQDPFTNGLVAYYPFNGNANDASGNGNNGSFSGATLTTDRLGVPNQAVHFDGSSTAMSASIASIPLGNSPRSLVAWIKPDDGSPINGVIDYGTNDCPGYMFGISHGKSGNGNIGFWGGCQDFASNLLAPSNQWSFVALTFDGTNMLFYVNGNSQSYAICPLNTLPSRLWVGVETLNDGGSFRDSFRGSIDDVRIYNRKLPFSEIQSLHTYPTRLATLIKAVKPVFSDLLLGTNYQLQISEDLSTWSNQGDVFTATNSSIIYPQYWDVDNWDKLFFRLQISP